MITRGYPTATPRFLSFSYSSSSLTGRRGRRKNQLKAIQPRCPHPHPHRQQHFHIPSQPRPTSRLAPHQNKNNSPRPPLCNILKIRVTSPHIRKASDRAPHESITKIKNKKYQKKIKKNAALTRPTSAAAAGHPFKFHSCRPYITLVSCLSQRRDPIIGSGQRNARKG